MANEIFCKLFPINVMSKSFHSEIQSLPVYSPYILGMDFAKGELKEEVVQLGVELSLYVAESMFLVCDDVRSVLRFCFFFLWKCSTKNLKSASPVGERLLRVIHYVYTKHIKPKNGVYQKGGKSVQWDLALSTLDNFVAGIKDLNTLVSLLTIGGNWSSDGRELTSRVEEAIEKVDEKLRDVEAIPKANGFARDDAVMKPNILELWKSLCDKDTQEPRAKKLMSNEMLSDLFPIAGVE